jgi:hypothetical protein
VVAVGIVAIVALLAGTLLVVEGAGKTAQATASPTVAVTASPSPSPSPSASPTPEPSPSPYVDPGPTPMPSGWAYSDLDGVATTAALAHRLPLAIMIDDNSVARPQSGISSASVVYQAPADGGEDRYMFVFQEGTATDIGPVRSARPYYVYWAMEWKALYGHFGGDVKVLQQVIPANYNSIYNMDDLNGGSCPYRRIDTRLSPHNAYATSAELISCAAAKGYPATYQKLPTWTFRDNILLANRPASQVVTIDYRTGTVGYQYDPSRDAYLRIVDGATDIDPANNAKVYAHDVAVLFQSVSIDPESEPGYNRPIVANVGSGNATLFIEGKTITATWKKTSNVALTRFYDAAGKEIPFVRGEIFMQSVPPGSAVTVK